jgi:mono/diheme cytochrome c family protein
MRALGAGLMLVASLIVCAQQPRAAAPQATTNDGIYTKEQADAAKAQYDKICAECHAFTVAALKAKDDLPLGDEPFLKKWEGKTIDELVTVIVLTMPNDGSAVVSEDEALNLMAYILQQNGAPAGKAPLTKTAAAATLARPKLPRS